MKTFSQICADFDAGKISNDKTYDVEVRDLVRIYKAHQKALEKVATLEAKIAHQDIAIMELQKSRSERAIYG